MGFKGVYITRTCFRDVQHRITFSCITQDTVSVENRDDKFYLKAVHFTLVKCCH